MTGKNLIKIFLPYSQVHFVKAVEPMMVMEAGAEMMTMITKTTIQAMMP